MSVHLYICPYVCTTVCGSIHQSIYPDICSYVCQYICVAAHATFDTEQLISCTRTALVAIATLQDSDKGVIPVQEVLELLTMTYDILDNAAFKQVGDTGHILTSLFNSASRQYHEVWASQYPFFTI